MSPWETLKLLNTATTGMIATEKLHMVSKYIFPAVLIRFWHPISNQVDPKASINNLRQCQWEQQSRNYWIVPHGKFQFSIEKTRKCANYPLRSTAYLHVPNWQKGFSKTKNEAWIWLIISASTILDIQQLKENIYIYSAT